MAGSSSSRTPLAADLGRPSSRVEGQLPVTISYSRCRPEAVGREGLLSINRIDQILAAPFHGSDAFAEEGCAAAHSQLLELVGKPTLPYRACTLAHHQRQRQRRHRHRRAQRRARPALDSSATPRRSPHRSVAVAEISGIAGRTCWRRASAYGRGRQWVLRLAGVGIDRLECEAADVARDRQLHRGLVLSWALHMQGRPSTTMAHCAVSHAEQTLVRSGPRVKGIRRVREARAPAWRGTSTSATRDGPFHQCRQWTRRP